MFHVDAKDLIKYEQKLRTLSSVAVGYAQRQALNDVAFTARRISLERTGRQLILRNTYTARSIRVDKASKASPRSIIGSTEDYMARQEFGGSTAKRGRIGVAIPTTYASGEGMGTKVRRRMPRAANKVQALKLFRCNNARGKAWASMNQRNFVHILRAPRGGNIFMLGAKRKGIYRVLGEGNSRKVRMLVDLSNERTETPRSEWLKPASMAAMSYMYAYYRKALRYQIDKLGAR